MTLRSIAAPVLLLAVLAACGGAEGGSNELLTGSLSVRSAGGAWTPVAAGPVVFETGTEIEAADGGATMDASVGDGARAEFRMGPGARVLRRGANAFDFAVGTVTVATTGLADRVLVYHSDALYAEAGRLVPGDATFTVTAVGGQMAVVVERGAVQLNVLNSANRELTFAKVGAGEQGLATPGGKPEKRHMDDSEKGPYLTPRISLEAAAGGAAAPLRLEVTIAAGQSGGFRGLPAAPDALTLIASGPGGERKVALDAMYILAETTAAGAVVADEAADDVLSIEAPDHGLAAGTWSLRVRYVSYREHFDGPEWIGAVESAPVSVTISD